MVEKIPFLSDERIRELAEKYGTPLHVYDEHMIAKTCAAFSAAFLWNPGFTNYFAVKALPNPHILEIVKEHGFGADCSSRAELELARAVGIKDIMFSSNNTSLEDYLYANRLGAKLNLDDVSHLPFLAEKMSSEEFPSFLSFRYNPGSTRAGNVIIGKPEEAKFGLTRPQLFEGFSLAKKLGVKRFGLHTMVVSNCLDLQELLATARMIFELVVEIKKELDIQIEMVDLGGGIGVAYKPEDTPIDLRALGEGVRKLYNEIYLPTSLIPLKITYECGRAITGPAGGLITRIIHMKDIYRKYIGVDACMTHLARPALYNAYHHITVIKEASDAPVLRKLPSKRTLFESTSLEKAPYLKVDVVGSLCENNDKFAIQRELPANTQIGDLLFIHDTGAHGHAMGGNYNGKLRCPEVLIKRDGTDVLIRRSETLVDLFKTVERYSIVSSVPGGPVVERVLKNVVLGAALLCITWWFVSSKRRYSGR